LSGALPGRNSRTAQRAPDAQVKGQKAKPKVKTPQAAANPAASGQAAERNNVAKTTILYTCSTKALGLAVIRLMETLPHRLTADVVGRQLLRAATSVGANYRAACRGQSPADVVAKLHVVLEEADETACRLELLTESGLASQDKVNGPMFEAHEIAAMTVASLNTLKSRYPRR